MHNGYSPHSTQKAEPKVICLAWVLIHMHRWEITVTHHTYCSFTICCHNWVIILPRERYAIMSKDRQYEGVKTLKCIGRYALCSKTLGKGNFARVELAAHTLINNKVNLTSDDVLYLFSSAYDNLLMRIWLSNDNKFLFKSIVRYDFSSLLSFCRLVTQIYIPSNHDSL